MRYCTVYEAIFMNVVYHTLMSKYPEELSAPSIFHSVSTETAKFKTPQFDIVNDSNLKKSIKS